MRVFIYTSFILFFLTSIFLIIGNIELPEAEYDPLGPAGVPIFINIVMVLLLIIDIYFSKNNNYIETYNIKPGVIKVIIFLGVTFTYLFFMEKSVLNFEVISFLYMISIGIILSGFRFNYIIIICVVSLFISLGVTHVFSDILNVFLP